MEWVGRDGHDENCDDVRTYAQMHEITSGRMHYIWYQQDTNKNTVYVAGCIHQLILLFELLPFKNHACVTLHYIRGYHCKENEYTVWTLFTYLIILATI